MEITKAIQQSRFASEMHKATINILYTSSWINYQQASVFKNSDITMKQFNILRILKGQYPKAATVNLLIERMIDKSSNASRIVDKLVEKGLVDRTTCKDDRRRVDVIISKKGLEVVNKASKDLENMALLKDALTDSEAQQLNRLLDKLRTKE